MLILGIEAAAKCCSAAIFDGKSVLAEEMSNAGFTHSETLMPMVDRVLSLAGKTLEEVDAIALTAGPGSFTGLRIGAATAKGLALGLNKPLIPVGTLEAASYLAGMGDGFVRVAIMDARRSQVYCAAYEMVRGENGEPLNRAVIEADTISPQQLLEKLENVGGPFLFMGDAALMYEDFFREKLGKKYYLAGPTVRELRASSVCALAYDRVMYAEKYGLTELDGKKVSIRSDELEIDYLRKPQAVREREAREAIKNQMMEDMKKTPGDAV